MTRRDIHRRREVRRIISGKKSLTPDDFYHVAFVFHHGPSKADSQHAVRLAQESVKRGSKKAKWLYAATVDRLLIKNGKRQKFGTQFRKKKNGEWILFPVDTKTTDAQRANLNVPPLIQLKRR